jgi:hypothetical protein
MSHKLDDGQNNQACDKPRMFYGSHRVESPAKIRAKRERLLTVLKSRYGYTNDLAVDEMERLLKQFDKTNKSLGIRRAKTDTPQQSVD